MPDLTDLGNMTITVTVNEWFQTLPRPELQQMDRHTLIMELQMAFVAELRKARAEMAEEIAAAIAGLPDLLVDGGLDDSDISGSYRQGVEHAARIARQHATT